VLEALGARQDLAGETVLVTAGPTREPIDPVRYISNRSSGKMGYALAEAAIRRGAKVVLVSGPAALKPPSSVEFVAIITAEEIRNAVLAHLENATIVIKAAAVADFVVRNPSPEKIKRKEPIHLELQPAPDILAEIARNKGARVVVGFAAETHNALENARKKLNAKSLDAIVLNDVSQPGIGFDSERNAVTILTGAGEESVPEMSKWEIAHRVLDAIVRIKAMRARTGKIESAR
jgi:phosphopantothenoylcysteine decarboxylase / phosphopantothenate---cysteine ligase